MHTHMFRLTTTTQNWCWWDWSFNLVPHRTDTLPPTPPSPPRTVEARNTFAPIHNNIHTLSNTPHTHIIASYHIWELIGLSVENNWMLCLMIVYSSTFSSYDNFVFMELNCVCWMQVKCRSNSRRVYDLVFGAKTWCFWKMMCLVQNIVEQHWEGRDLVWRRVARVFVRVGMCQITVHLFLRSTIFDKCVFIKCHYIVILN